MGSIKIRIAMTRLWILLGFIAVGLGGCAPNEATMVAPTPQADIITMPVEPTLSPTVQEETFTPKKGVTPEPEETVIYLETGVAQETTVPMIGSIPTDPTIAGLVNLAREDLSRQLSLPVDEIQFVDFQAVVWPDGSLGCPQPGMLYIQVQQEGYLIRLQHGMDIYEYHGGPARPPFLCENKAKP